MVRHLAYFYYLVLLCQSLSAIEISPPFTLMLPMRDGHELPTDIYLPVSTSPSEKFPCILLRNPAGRKNLTTQSAVALAKFGYAIAIQETRSTMDAEGKTFPYISDGWGEKQDGYDTVEWLAKSSFTNGKIGTFGASASGITQLMLAPSAPPSLRCQYIKIAAANLYQDAISPGGQILKNQVEGWLGLYAKDSGVHGYIHGNPFYNDFWKKFNTIEVANQVHVPAIHYGGWFDTFVQGTIDAFLSRQNFGGKGARGTQKLLIGPWTHFWPLHPKLGDFDMPQQGKEPPFDMSPQHWFDFYLKDIANNADHLPNVTYYVMGPFDGSPSRGNIWRTADSWPIPCVETPFYFTADHKLVEGTAPQAGKMLSYDYDPNHPIPTIGGRNLFLESGPKDQQLIEKRTDILLFTSDPLQDDLEVTGRIIAKIQFSSDQIDTDVVVRLSDVYPDGRSILIADGIYRTGLVNYAKTDGHTGKQQEIEVDLWSTSLVFAKGHCIRASISSSNFPRFEKNRNVGLFGSHTGNFNIARNTLHFGGVHGCRLLLPVVRP